ncbi:MAG TPA: DUF6677 family protein, partial [Candidatus Acidoferrum sp.]
MTEDAQLPPSNDPVPPSLPPTGAEVESVEPVLRRELRSWTFAIAGWLIPGLGHALQKMWGRAAIVFIAVGLLVFTGASMRGNVFASNGGDAFD